MDIICIFYTFNSRFGCHFCVIFSLVEPSFWCQGANYVSRFKIQDSGMHLPNISLCLGDSTERSNGSPGRTLGKILYGFRVLTHVFGIDALRAFQDSGANWQCV